MELNLGAGLSRASLQGEGIILLLLLQLSVQVGLESLDLNGKVDGAYKALVEFVLQLPHHNPLLLSCGEVAFDQVSHQTDLLVHFGF